MIQTAGVGSGPDGSVRVKKEAIDRVIAEGGRVGGLVLVNLKFI